MRLEELQILVEGKSFKSTVCGQVYRFLRNNILQVNSDRTAQYSILETSNRFLLEHNSLLGQECLIIKVEDMKFPVTLTLYKKSDFDFFTTFIEE